MKATSFLLHDPSLTRARPKQAAPMGRTGFFARLDRWFWRQTQREREAYLAGARDIYDLEERIRRLERSVAPVRY